MRSVSVTAESILSHAADPGTNSPGNPAKVLPGVRVKKLKEIDAKNEASEQEMERKEIERKEKKKKKREAARTKAKEEAKANAQENPSV